MTNYKLVLCYDGTKYNGWQRLGDTDNTIQNKVETLLSRLLEQPVEVIASGRTDAGVHALRQVCSFKATTDMTDEEILEGIRRFLPNDIGAISLEQADPRFHARYNALRKTYVYRVKTNYEPSVFERKYLFYFRHEIDVQQMRVAASFLCGEHDFSAFTSAKHMTKSAVRRIESIDIEPLGGGVLELTFTGSGFLRNMVRIMTGTLLEVGTGRRSAWDIPEVINSGARSEAGFMAPPEGLFLKDVEYPE